MANRIDINQLDPQDESPDWVLGKEGSQLKRVERARRVTSVNEQVGDVVLDHLDVGAQQRNDTLSSLAAVLPDNGKVIGWNNNVLANLTVIEDPSMLLSQVQGTIVLNALSFGAIPYDELYYNNGVYYSDPGFTTPAVDSKTAWDTAYAAARDLKAEVFFPKGKYWFSQVVTADTQTMRLSGDGELTELIIDSLNADLKIGNGVSEPSVGGGGGKGTFAEAYGTDNVVEGFNPSINIKSFAIRDQPINGLTYDSSTDVLSVLKSTPEIAASGITDFVGYYVVRRGGYGLKTVLAKAKIKSQVDTGTHYEFTLVDDKSGIDNISVVAALWTATDTGLTYTVTDNGTHQTLVFTNFGDGLSLKTRLLDIHWLAKFQDISVKGSSSGGGGYLYEDPSISVSTIRNGDVPYTLRIDKSFGLLSSNEDLDWQENDQLYIGKGWDSDTSVIEVGDTTNFEVGDRVAVFLGSSLTDGDGSYYTDYCKVVEKTATTITLSNPLPHPVPPITTYLSRRQPSFGWSDRRNNGIVNLSKIRPNWDFGGYIKNIVISQTEETRGAVAFKLGNYGTAYFTLENVRLKGFNLTLALSFHMRFTNVNCVLYNVDSNFNYAIQGWRWRDWTIERCKFTCLEDTRVWSTEQVNYDIRCRDSEFRSVRGWVFLLFGEWLDGGPLFDNCTFSGLKNQFHGRQINSKFIPSNALSDSFMAINNGPFYLALPNPSRMSQFLCPVFRSSAPGQTDQVLLNDGALVSVFHDSLEVSFRSIYPRAWDPAVNAEGHINSIQNVTRFDFPDYFPRMLLTEVEYEFELNNGYDSTDFPYGLSELKMPIYNIGIVSLPLPVLVNGVLNETYVTNNPFAKPKYGSFNVGGVFSIGTAGITRNTSNGPLYAGSGTFLRMAFPFPYNSVSVDNFRAMVRDIKVRLKFWNFGVGE